MLKSNNCTLVVIDVQGKLATLMHEKELFLENVVRMIKGAQALDIPILWNEQLPDKLGPTIPEIKEILTDNLPMVKKVFSCAGNADFIERLKSSGRRQVLLTGMETHVCVYQTALDLLGDGFEVYLVADAVSSRTLDNKKVGIAAITAAGAKITSVEMAFFEMLGVAEGERFKKIIKIVK
ncbi:MAG: hydrolase [FCB group bacterium]|nr:hydrolase [FCB group bacterium]